jgi:putative beta-lysine N-acetyltransferase
MTISEQASGREVDTAATISGAGFVAEVLLSQLNLRVQVRGYEGDSLDAMVAALSNAARQRGFSKVFLKAPLQDQAPLEDAGMAAEATIVGFYAGKPAVVMSLFLDSERQERPCLEEQEAILSAIQSRPRDSSVPQLPQGYRMTIADAGDAEELAGLYSGVFESYPYPIDQPEYLVTTMESHVVYRIIRDGDGVLVAAASAETELEHRNAEMTDFATLPNQRGLGLAQHILAELEKDMEVRSIPNLYTIARARSAGMNRVFYNRGYSLTGTLVNNCHISGQFEDMHVWCKALEPAP